MSGGGGDNSGMTAMMAQQQASSDARAASDAAYRQQQDQYNRRISERDYRTDRYDNKRSEQLAAQAAANQARQQQQSMMEQRASEQRALEYARQQQAVQRQQELQDRQYAAQQAMQERQRQAAAQQKATQQERVTAQRTAAQTRETARRTTVTDQRAALKERQQLQNWREQRNATFNNQKNAAFAQMEAQGIKDPTTRRALITALQTARDSIPELTGNQGSYYGGIYDTVLGEQGEAYKQRTLNSYDSLLPMDYGDNMVAGTLDDSFIESILGEQLTAAQEGAKRLMDRGVTTQEGYDANLKALEGQKAKGRVSLSAIGDNELSSQRTAIANLINQGRSAASSAQLGSNFDPTSYQNKIKSSYDTWFAGLGDKLKGLAPTDLFDTSSFLNTAGAVSGPTNSPYVGSTNALTGDDATTETDESKKKKAMTGGTTATTGVF